jgi:tetratricopeptide (TPR) repeat protein
MTAWIPRKIMPDIRKAIETADRFTHVFYITSAGGEGKTILLRQIGIELGSPDGIIPSFPWSGILDLYHSDVNSSSGLETRLSQALETAGEFQRYRDERDAYAARREAGYVGSELETERARMAEVFAECMNAVTRWSRVTIALDTTERMQYEVDEIQKLCGLEDETTTVRAWLVDQLLRWKNCVVLLVGRPEADPYLGQALAEVLTDDPRVHFEAKTLGGFDKDEAAAYFEQKRTELPAPDELDSEFCHRLWEITEGCPIRLDLAIEVIKHGLGFDQFRDRVMTGEAEVVREEIDRLLIDHVMRGEPDSSVRDVLRYLAVARKGLDVDLFRHLAGGLDRGDCQKRLDAVAERGFVKQHTEDERLFLHDEMYRLCDIHLLQPEDVQRLSRRIVEWYDDHIDASEDERERRDLQVDSLLYRLRANPREGYQWYAQQAEPAIRAAEVGLDMRMRSEVLAFLKSPSPIDQLLLRDTPGLQGEISCDDAARWARRYMTRGQNEVAVRIVEQVSMPPAGPCLSDDPYFRLARAHLGVLRAEAMIYTGRAEEAVTLLKPAIADLEGGQRPEVLAQQEPHSFLSWRRNLVLGRAYNDLGYAYMRYLKHYRAAVTALRSALPYFRASDLREELANTNSNMGRVYALLRHPTRAETLVNESLALRRELGRDYRIGLSLVSRAIVHLEFDEPHRARRLVEGALSIFEGLSAQRGVGLALITLGRTLRHLGGLWTEGLYSFQDCERFFSDGVAHLDRAVGIFDRDVNEPLQLVEALNELGCIYRDRARLAQIMAPGRPLARTISAEATKRLERCIDLTDYFQFSVEYVDACEDLAQTYFLRRDYDNTRLWLERAEERAPEAYKFKRGEQLSEIPEEKCVEAFWLQMGKIELLYGNLVFDLGTDGGTKPASPQVLEETALHYLLSAAYFEEYSELAVGLRSTFGQMYVRFKHSSLDELAYLQREALPAMAREYNIGPSRLGRFFQDTLGLALEWHP